jgi:hypothetical protein
MNDKGLSRRRFLGMGAAAGAGVLVGGAPALAAAQAGTGAAGSRQGQLQIFVNNVGYEPRGPKRIVIGGESGSGTLPFEVVDTTSGAVVHRGQATFVGPVERWAEDASPAVPKVYWTADLSALTTEGQYVVVVGGRNGADSVSYPFLVQADIYARKTLSPILHYFKGSRSSGQYAKRDSHLPVGQGGQTYVDVHGGWYDATGDFGIHFGQAFPNAPQFLTSTQVPLLAWVLFAAYGQLQRRQNGQLAVARAWLLDEAMYGADFLVRMHPKNGSFYSSINQPELDKPTPDGEYEPSNVRYLEAKQGQPVLVSFRLGGGSAVAALAAASTYKVSGDFDNRRYLATAVEAFQYLQQHNLALNRGTPDNILDESEALVAATELYRATREHRYMAAAQAAAGKLMGRLGSWHQYHGYWRAGADDRPFFNATSEGLPAVYLANYLDIASPHERQQATQVLRQAMQFALQITGEAANPFGYAKEFVQDGKGRRYINFFYPHDVTPSIQQGGWWQGENARIASLATAARLVSLQSTIAGDAADDFTRQLEQYATDQLNWICGLNPYASCMLNGVGLNNPEYYDADGTWQFLPHAGGINNGIAGVTARGQGIGYEPNYRFGGFQQSPDVWRHMEQWLPHSTWFLYATAIGPTFAS